MGCLDNVGRAGGGHDGDAEAEEEPTAHELVGGVGSGDAGDLDDDADDDDERADEHASPTAPGVDGWADKGDCCHRADLVHRRDDS